MTIQSATVTLQITAGLGVQVPSQGIASELILGNAYDGPRTAAMSASASMSMNASTLQYKNQGGPVGGTNSIVVSYPNSVATGDLILFVGGVKQYFNGFTNANFIRGGWSHDKFSYFHEFDATGRTNNYNTLGVDIGPSRVEHHWRIATAAHTGTETFTTGATANMSAVGQMFRFAKNPNEEWVIKSYGYWGSPLLDNIGTQGDATLSYGGGIPNTGPIQVYGTLPAGAQVKISSLNARAIAGSGDVTIVTGNETWISSNGYMWKQITHPLGTDTAYRMRYANGTFIMCGTTGKIARSTNNGSSWTVTQPFDTSHAYRGLQYGRGVWLIGATSGLIGRSTDDGVTWTWNDIPTESQTFFDFAWGDGISDNYPEGWGAQGRWFAVGSDWDMYHSQDNGATWSFWNWYDTNWASYLPPYGDAQSIMYQGSGRFIATGSNDANNPLIGNYSGRYSHGYFWGDDATQPFWNVRISGFDDGYPAAVQQGYRNSDSFRAWKFGNVWDQVVYHRDGWGRYEYPYIGATSANDGLTFSWQQTIQAAAITPVYDRPFLTYTPPPGTKWETIYGPGKWSYMDGGQWMTFQARSNGEITLENFGYLNNTGTPTEEMSEALLAGNGFADIRDGDIIVISVSTSNSSETLSNFDIWTNNKGNNWWINDNTTNKVSPRFTPWTLLSEATSTSGDKIKTYTGYVTAIGDAGPVFYEDSYYDPSNNYHWVSTRSPDLVFSFNATNPIFINGSRQVVYTVLHAQPMGVKGKITASLTADAVVKKTGVEAGNPGALYEASMVVDAFVEPNTTPVFLDGNYQGNNTSSTTIDLSAYYPNVISPGMLIVVYVAADNLSATTPTITVSDQTGLNTWTQIGFKGQNATAAGGCVAGLFYSVLNAAIPYGNYIRATFSGAIAAKIMAYKAFGGCSGVTIRNSTTNSGTSALPTVTSGTANSNDVAVGVVAVENSTAPTNDSDTLNGSWVSYAGISSTGGNALGHMAILASHKILTGSGAQTLNPATSPSTDWATVLGILANPPAKFSAAVMRANPLLTVSAVVNKTYTTTGSCSAAGNLTATADVQQGAGLVVGTIIHAKTIDMADALHIVPATATLTAIALNPTPDAHLSNILSATVAPMTASATLTPAENVVKVLTATVSTTIIATATGTSGNVLSASASCTAQARAVADGVYLKEPENPSHPDNDYQPPVDTPPGDADWHRFTSTYGPTGSIGNVVELTNRHYQDAFRATTLWPEWPFPNSPPGEWYEFRTWNYAMGCRGSAVTALGDDRFLVTWAQENWVVYQESWYTPGVPVERILHDVPMILVATIVDCSSGAPVITGTSRYEMPLQWRWYRNSNGQMAQYMGLGEVACVWTGFMNIQDNFIMDHGSLTNLFHHSANIVCNIDAAGPVPTFDWVKRVGGDWNGIETLTSNIMTWGSNIFMVRSGPTQTQVTKFSGSGNPLGHTSTIPAGNDTVGKMSCAVFGDTGVLFYTDGSQLLARNIDLGSLSVGSEYEVRYRGGNINIYNRLRACKQGSDGKWYAGVAFPDKPAYGVLKLDFVDGKLIVESVHWSDVANCDAFSPFNLSRGNAYRAYSSYEPWYTNLYPDEELRAYSPAENFCAGIQNPSVVGIAEYIPYDQKPEHVLGPQVVANLAAEDDEGNPINPMAWVSSPSADTLTNWKSYFSEGYPQYVTDLDCAETSSGKILVVLCGVEDLLDKGYKNTGNGIFRIFAYIADPANDPPPLKMSQRDDGKTVGGDRLAYDSQNSGSIRVGRVAW